MHYNTLFQDRNLKNFLGRGTAPLNWRRIKTLPRVHPTPSAPTAPQSPRLRRSVLCVPYFQFRFLATLTVTNVVQGKQSQRWKFTGPPNQKSWLRQWLCHWRFCTACEIQRQVRRKQRESLHKVICMSSINNNHPQTQVWQCPMIQPVHTYTTQSQTYLLISLNIQCCSANNPRNTTAIYEQSSNTVLNYKFIWKGL